MVPVLPHRTDVPGTSRIQPCARSTGVCVAGRSVRKYTDEIAVADAAEAAGYADIYDTRLITLTAMERLMGKKTFNEVLGDLVVKPMGKPTLAPDTDKRPALDIHSTQTEFTKTESR